MRYAVLADHAKSIELDVSSPLILLNPHYDKGQALEATGRLKDAVAGCRTVLEKAGSRV